MDSLTAADKSYQDHGADIISDKSQRLNYAELLRRVVAVRSGDVTMGDVAVGDGAMDEGAKSDHAGEAHRLKELQAALTTFRLEYKFGIDEVLTKINILREEFEQTQDHSPIEHVRTRLKSMESLLNKVIRTQCPAELGAIRDQIRDIAGIRVVCSFASDVYWIAQMLSDQPDITVIEIKDYIARPKPNGYQSLHVIVQVPVFLSNRTVHIYVELQIRTIAMDFWASLEHKIYYKYDREVPQRLLDELKDAARVASELDDRMANLRDEVHNLDARGSH